MITSEVLWLSEADPEATRAPGKAPLSSEPRPSEWDFHTGTALTCDYEDPDLDRPSAGRPRKNRNGPRGIGQRPGLELLRVLQPGRLERWYPDVGVEGLRLPERGLLRMPSPALLINSGRRSPYVAQNSVVHEAACMTDGERLQRMIDELRRMREHCEPKSPQTRDTTVTPWPSARSGGSSMILPRNRPVKSPRRTKTKAKTDTKITARPSDVRSQQDATSKNEQVGVGLSFGRKGIRPGRGVRPGR